jgi:hypothetical protein
MRCGSCAFFACGNRARYRRVSAKLVAGRSGVSCRTSGRFPRGGKSAKLEVCPLSASRPGAGLRAKQRQPSKAAMTNEQLYFAIGVPSLINIGLITLLYVSLSQKIDTKIDSLAEVMNAKFDAAHQALLRVEGILDARLKHLEEALDKR